jgi:hypothetical protein
VAGDDAKQQGVHGLLEFNQSRSVVYRLNIAISEVLDCIDVISFAIGWFNLLIVSVARLEVFCYLALLLPVLALIV